MKQRIFGVTAVFVWISAFILMGCGQGLGKRTYREIPKSAYPAANEESSSEGTAHVVLREYGAWGWGLFGVIWGLALAGLVLTLFWITSPRWVTSGIYIFMGWLALAAILPLMRCLPSDGFFWVLGGGILYTIGGVLYAVKWPGRYNPRFGCHEIFHLFILLGSFFHFMLMYLVVARL